MLTKINPEAAKRLMVLAQEDVTTRWKLYEDMAMENGGNGHTTVGQAVTGVGHKA
jgi:hypothetical protein